MSQFGGFGRPIGPLEGDPEASDERTEAVPADLMPLAPAPDLGPVLEAIRSRLVALAARPLVADDPICADLLARMATPAGSEMDAFHRLVEDLEARVEALCSGNAAGSRAFAAAARPATRSRTLLKL